MFQPSCRDFLQASATATLASAVTAIPSLSNATEEKNVSTSGNAFQHQHTAVPLPFEAKSLKGLSEKLIQSHWEHNYGGAVKALNAVRGRLTQVLNDANTPPYVYNGLKREQLFRTGSVVLHELYFANLGGDTPSELRHVIENSCHRCRRSGGNCNECGVRGQPFS